MRKPTDCVALNRNVMLVGAVLALGAAVSLGLWVTRALMRQLGGEPQYATDVAREIAAGNLTVDIALRAGDRSSMLARHGRDARMATASVVSSDAPGPESVSMASTQIAASNADLSQRTEEQASALQQTTATMEVSQHRAQQRRELAPNQPTRLRRCRR